MTDFLDDVGHAVPDAQDHHMQEMEATRGSLGGLDRFTLLVGGGLLHLFHTGCGADMVVIMATEPPEIVSESDFPVPRVLLEVFRCGL